MKNLHKIEIPANKKQPLIYKPYRPEARCYQINTTANWTTTTTTINIRLR